MAPGINHLSWFWSKTHRTYSRCQENDVVLVINSFSRDKKFDSFSHYFWCVCMLFDDGAITHTLRMLTILKKLCSV